MFAYQDPGLSTETRVGDLLGRMTLEEKVAQLQCRSTMPPIVPIGTTPAFGIVKDGTIDESVARSSMPDGMGAFWSLSFFTATAAAHAAEMNLIQSWVMANTRLGIPLMFVAEGLHGAVIKGATSFPQAIGLGSSWDRELLKEIFTVVGRELRSTGISLALAPVLDLARDPRYGRVEEMYSEDPFLVGVLGLHAVQGLQGGGPSIDEEHVIATAKHFVHGQPENGTNVGPNDFSERTMRDTFLAPFEKAVRVGGMGAVMPSYNENNGGLPSSANPWLLKDILRREWGFEGLTFSDGGAVARLHTEQGLAATVDGAGRVAFNAGVDIEFPGAEGFPGLVAAVNASEVRLDEIDAEVRRVLTAKFDAGLFERPYADVERVATVVGSDEHRRLARRAADQAVILLKNDGGLLPLDATQIATLAVIGPNADKVRVGTYSAAASRYVSVLDGIRARLGEAVTVNHAEGVRLSEPDEPGSNTIAPYAAPTEARDADLIGEAVATARAADAVVLVLGGNEALSREAFGTLMGPDPVYGDTDDLELPGRQNELVRQVVALGKPTVAVLLNGRPYSIQRLSESVPAILEGWYLGEATGNAIAGILFGDVNPSGRLPVTIARNVGQLPVFYYRKPTARLGYVSNDNTPLYAFGHGLSYTEFTYGQPVLDRVQIDSAGTACVSVTVTNVGARAGAEVVQLYVHPRISSVVQPIVRLVGFERVYLEPGQAVTVSFAVGPEQLAIWDSSMRHTVEAGIVDVTIGPNAAQTSAVQLDVVT